MSNLKNTTANPGRINLYEPAEASADSAKFIKNFKAKYISSAGVHVIGRIDNGIGCFTIKDNKLSFYQDTPQNVLTYIKGQGFIDATFYEVDGKMKYLYLQMIKILKDHQLW